jgi:hypothetical protein
MMFDLERIRDNVRQATTEDLLDRVTAYRAGMEPEALRLMETELRDRDISPDEIEAHAEKRRRESKLHPDGTALRCTFCRRPAVAEGWGWHKLWGLVPLIPMFYRYCSQHLPPPASPPPDPESGEREQEGPYASS